MIREAARTAVAVVVLAGTYACLTAPIPLTVPASIAPAAPATQPAALLRIVPAQRFETRPLSEAIGWLSAQIQFPIEIIEVQTAGGDVDVQFVDVPAHLALDAITSNCEIPAYWRMEGDKIVVSAVSPQETEPVLGRIYAIAEILAQRDAFDHLCGGTSEPRTVQGWDRRLVQLYELLERFMHRRPIFLGFRGHLGAGDQALVFVTSEELHHQIAAILRSLED